VALPVHRLRVTTESAATLSGLHPALRRQVRAALTQIAAHPGAGNPLIRELTGLWSFRVGRWRIVYRVAAHRIVELVAVGPRRTIYELTLRLISRAR
jgi:mRNA interferase RelE/StbE